MMDYGLPVLIALFSWWFCTGAVLYLDGLPKHTFKWSMLGGSAVALLGFWGIAESAQDETAHGAMIAFLSALALWGWLEMSFYMGFVTGLSKERSPEGMRGWPHLKHALKANVWHELAILGFGIVILAITWDAPNRLALWIFLVFGWMHESARLNVLFGVRNVNAHFLPEHLDFLKGYLTQRPMNLFFPLSVTVSTIVAAFLVEAAVDADDAYQRAGYTYLATIMILATLEHWFLVLPLPSERLWEWGLKSRNQDDAAPASARIGSESWTRDLDGVVAADRLNVILSDVHGGRYGSVDRVAGIALTESGWLRFEAGRERPVMIPVAGQDGARPAVTATGRNVDRGGLSDAFSRCLMPETACYREWVPA